MDLITYAVLNKKVSHLQGLADLNKGDKGDKGDVGPQGERGYSGMNPKVELEYAANITAAANTKTIISTLTGPLTLTLGEQVEGFDNEYDVVIQQGAAAQTITLPNIRWGMGIAPSFNANSITTISLYYIGNLLCGEWSEV